MMLKRTLLTALAAAGALAFAASAQAAYLTLGTSNTSNTPTTLTGNTAGSELLVKNSNGSSASAFGLYGLLTPTSPTVSATAVRGQNSSTNGKGYGMYGSQAGSGTGVRGFAPGGKGVWGTSTSGTGILGQHTATSGTAAGVEGDSAASASAGVRGQNSGGGPGVYGQSSGYGVWGEGSYGLVGGGSAGGVWATTGNVNGSGVYGQNTSGGGNGVHGTGNVGVKGTGVTFGLEGLSTHNYGVVGSSSDGTGVEGESETGDAGLFVGHVEITGGCSGCAGAALKIDDPLDPAHKYLQHSTVVSPQMKDVYDGNVTTDGRGFATVKMPGYFQALNRSFRYQLTPIGHRAWGAQAIVWDPIKANRFTIRSKPHVKISWQVTGIRHDRYANAHRVRVVVPKPKAEQGKYVHPEVYGKPRSQGIGYQKPPRVPKKPTLPKSIQKR